MPIRTRITLISAGLMAVVLAATGLFLFFRLKTDLRTAVDEGLDSRADALLFRVADAAPLPDGGPVLEGESLLETDEAFAQIYAEDGTLLESSPGLPGPLLRAGKVVNLQGMRFLEQTVPTQEETIPARLLAVRSREGPVVVVGTSLEHQKQALATLLPLLWVGGPFALGLATVVVWLLAGVALQPVERMRAEAEAFSLGEPGRRLPVPGTRDEIARLGETLNDLLGRLEEALNRERRFVDEASHELRTPLALLKTELDLALRGSRTKDELESALRSAAEESDALARIAEDLLVLARADRGRLPVTRTDVDLVDLAGHVAETLKPRAEQRGIALQVRGPDATTVRADPLRVRQALWNVVDNALRHTPSEGKVTIHIARDGDAALLEVTDTGPGFAEDLLPRALEPFTRGEGTRTRAEGGAGLGLAIVRAVAEAHGGSVSIRNQAEGGASVRLRLPG